jgi:hypothetical protein
MYPRTEINDFFAETSLLLLGNKESSSVYIQKCKARDLSLTNCPLLTIY